MITVETIVNELNSLPEPLLAEVLSFIRGAKNKFVQPSQQFLLFPLSLKSSRQMHKAYGQV